LSDFYPHGAVAEAYGVLEPWGFARRSLVVVDVDGRVAWAREYEIGELPETRELLEHLESLPPP
jgi:hypothetical protein